MTTQNYCIVDQGTNICTNVCLWDGNVQTWTPPANSLMLVQATTPSRIWVWDESIGDCVLQETTGSGCVNFTWDGTYLVTNQPKPSIVTE